MIVFKVAVCYIFINSIRICSGENEINCIENEECSPYESCINHVCVNPCRHKQCDKLFPNTWCDVSNHTAFCICNPGLTLGPSGCIPEVLLRKRRSADEDFTSKEEYLNEICNDPSKKKSFVSDLLAEEYSLDYQEANNTGNYNHGHKRDGKGVPIEKRQTCSSNNDCSPIEACQGGVCTNPCTYATCGTDPNAICVPENHTPKCHCKEHFKINPQGICVPKQCNTDNDCDLSETCSDGRCTDACENYVCPANAKCLTRNHKSRCKCKPGFHHHKDGCVPEQCTVDDDCKPKLKCEHHNCVDPCEKGRYDCMDPNAQCLVRNHIPKCKCLQGFRYKDKTCIPATKCSSNDTCGNFEACIGGYCTDPCDYVTCPKNHTCAVHNHITICRCSKPGYVDSVNGCIPSGKDPSGKNCTSDDDCISTESCQSGTCYNPCDSVICDTPNSECLANNHKAICKCKPGYTKNKIGECVGGPNCLSDSDCKPSEACRQGKCFDVCKVFTCGDPNAVCTPLLNHKVDCTCKDGYKMINGKCSPYKIQCWTDADCKPSEACRVGKCFDVCKVFTCGDPNAVCNPLLNHTVDCYCKDGYRKINGTCVPSSQGGGTKCSTDSDCDLSEACINGNCINACKAHPCDDPNAAACVPRNHGTYCPCKEGYYKSPYGVCIAMRRKRNGITLFH